MPEVTLLLKASVNALKEDPKAAKRRFREVGERATARSVCPGCKKAIKHRSLTADQCADRQMSEKVLQNRVVDRAKRRGWKVAHAGKGWVGETDEGGGMWVTPMSPGWPDLTLAKAGHRLVFMECKREQGEVEPEQWVWLGLLNECGARAVVIRPSDLREGRVNAILDQGSPLNG